MDTDDIDDRRWTGYHGLLARCDAIGRRLFARHLKETHHEGDRTAYRGTDLHVGFERYIIRTYLLSWGIGLFGGIIGIISGGIVVGLVSGGLGKWATVWLRRRYLRWRAAARRADIERTLPGAVRYLRVLATGNEELRAMVTRVANNRTTYGHTAVAMRRALNRAALAGSIDRGFRSLARDTPSDLLAPLLLKLQEHATQGRSELRSYLELESRMLQRQQTHTRRQQEGLSEVLAELFVLLLAAPALVVIVSAVASVFAAGLSQPVATPIGTYPLRTLLLECAAVGIVGIGVLSVRVITSVQPSRTGPTYRRPTEIRAMINTVGSNPVSAAYVLAPAGVIVAGVITILGQNMQTAGVVGYAVWGIPVGGIAMRRARIDAAKDRELRDFVHALAGHITLGRPLQQAIGTVREELTLQTIDTELRALETRMQMTTGPGSVRTTALEQFADEIRTPLARQVIELLVGGLHAGSDSGAVFEALETEVDRLYREQRTLGTGHQGYVIIGWTTALLIIVITIAVSLYLLPGLTQLHAIADAGTAVGLPSQQIDDNAMIDQFYLITQASMLSCGWFAGTASGSWYEGLFHSGVLVIIAAGSFWLVGL